MLKKLFTSSDFAKNTFTLVIGTVIAQAIPLSLHPFLRRIYSPEDFGAMAVYLNLFGLITIISSLRYEAAVVLPKNNNEAANVLSLAFIINCVFCVLGFVALLLAKTQIAAFINFPERYSNYLYLLPFAAFLFGIYQSMNYWLVRNKAFKASTYNKITRRVVEGASQLVLGIVKFPGGLFVGDVFGNMANVISGLNQLFKNNFNIQQVSAIKIGYVFKKFIDYPKYNVIPTLFSSIANVLPFLIINKIYSTETVGYLDLSKLVLSIPLIFISATLSQVLFQQITERKHAKQSVSNEIKNIIYFLLAIVVIEIAVIQLFGPQLFGFVFGENYALSGTFSKILVFSFTLNFIGSTFSSVFLTFEKIKMNSYWQIIYFAAICSLFLFKSLSITSFLWMYVGIEVVMHSIYCLLVYNVIKQYERSVTV